MSLLMTLSFLLNPNRDLQGKCIRSPSVVYFKVEVANSEKNLTWEIRKRKEFEGILGVLNVEEIGRVTCL